MTQASDIDLAWYRKGTVSDVLGVSGLSDRQWVMALIATSFAVRAIFASAVGLGIDESYTVSTSRYLDLSYFDHPPAAWWLSWAAAHIAGNDSEIVVRLPFLVLFVVTTWLMYRTGALLFSERAGLWAAVTLNLAPVFGITTGSWVLPDGPLMMSMLACVLCVARVLFVPNTSSRWWLAAGVFAGLALLSKYHGIFLFAGVVLFLATQPGQRRWFASPWPYAAVLIALGIFAPVIVWNSEHHWMSFLFQSERATPGHLQPWGPLIAIAGQCMFLAPWIGLPLLASWIASIRVNTQDPKRWFLCCLGATPIVLFTILPVWASGQVFFHWAAPGYLMLFPLLGREIAIRGPAWSKYIRAWLIGSAAIVGAFLTLVGIELRTHWIADAWPVEANFRYPLVAAFDWTELRTALAARNYGGGANLFVAGTLWDETGRIDYAMKGAFPVVCLCGDDSREYGILDKTSNYAARDALIVGPNLTLARVMEKYGTEFDRIDALDPVILRHGRYPLLTFAVFRGHRFNPPSQTRLPQS